MLAERRRALPDIHRHVQDRAPGAAHQLALRARRGLEVQAPQHAALGGKGVVVLDERLIHPVLGHQIRAEHLGEETTGVAVLARRRDQQYVRDGEAFNMHGDISDLAFVTTP